MNPSNRADSERAGMPDSTPADGGAPRRDAHQGAPDIPEYRFLGVRMHAMTVEAWLDAVAAAVRTRSRCMMVGQNLHSVYLCHHDATLARAQEEAQYVRIDGLPLIWMGRLLGLPLSRRHRSGFMDLAWPLFERAEAEGWKVYYLGAEPGVAERGAAVIRARFPQLALAFDHGHFDATDGSPENQRRLAAIRAFAPDLLIVGMGMPRQERWMARYRDALDVPAMVASGAAMDFIAGKAKAAPRWLSALGLEWAFRLLAEPTRLWRRYLVEPWFVVGLFVRDLRARRSRRGPP